ncbi:MAG: hypothetical protein N2691_06195 [Patescibacteria group bacterium]|nr:hypothetical protein [Patescibacteria group bacterium]
MSSPETSSFAEYYRSPEIGEKIHTAMSQVVAGTYQDAYGNRLSFPDAMNAVLQINRRPPSYGFVRAVALLHQRGVPRESRDIARIRALRQIGNAVLAGWKEYQSSGFDSLMPWDDSLNQLAVEAACHAMRYLMKPDFLGKLLDGNKSQGAVTAFRNYTEHTASMLFFRKMLERNNFDPKRVHYAEVAPHMRDYREEFLELYGKYPSYIDARTELELAISPYTSLPDITSALLTEYKDQIMSALPSNLDEGDRKIIEARVFSGKTLVQTAQELRMSFEQVRRREVKYRRIIRATLLRTDQYPPNNPLHIIGMRNGHPVRVSVPPPENGVYSELPELRPWQVARLEGAQYKTLRELLLRLVPYRADERTAIVQAIDVDGEGWLRRLEEKYPDHTHWSVLHRIVRRTDAHAPESRPYFPALFGWPRNRQL